jgi:hypothetical protein
MMAGTVTITEANAKDWPISKVTFDWLSSAGGAADGTTTDAYTGKIVRVVQIPGAAGVQPTDAYDITILDTDSADVLAGQGANISNAGVTQVVTPVTLGCVVESRLTLGVTNAGNAKTGKTIVYISKVG